MDIPAETHHTATAVGHQIYIYTCTVFLAGHFLPNCKSAANARQCGSSDYHGVRSKTSAYILTQEETMLKSLFPAFGVALALTIATSVQAAPLMPIPPLHQPDGMITQVRAGCGVGFQRVRGVCVRNTTARGVRRTVRRARRCVRWHGGACSRWSY